MWSYDVTCLSKSLRSENPLTSTQTRAYTWAVAFGKMTLCQDPISLTPPQVKSHFHTVDLSAEKTMLARSHHA
jgi:hypothetical protein